MPSIPFICYRDFQIDENLVEACSYQLTKDDILAENC